MTDTHYENNEYISCNIQTIGFQDITPSAFVITRPNGDMIVKINSDGEITIGEGFTPTEAGLEFLESLKTLSPSFFKERKS